MKSAIIGFTVTALVASVLVGGCSGGEKKNPVNPDDSSGTFTDPRDGTTYKTMIIGTQTWMAENLDVGEFTASVDDGTIHADVSDNDTIEKYVYNNDEGLFGTVGGLYDWNEAMAYDTAEGARGICPEGWHIPTDGEWQTLEIYLGMSAAQAGTTSWRGTDQGTKLKVGGSSGFNGHLTGMRELDGGYGYFGSAGLFWSSSPYSSAHSWYRSLSWDTTAIDRSFMPKTAGACIRCIKD